MNARVATAPALATLLATLAPAGAADLARIDRSIAREPAYQSKSPRYCLLVFGPEMKTRVWLVWDGDVVYVDRNGNGDLTEAGECLPVPRFRPSGQIGIREEREVRLDSLTDGKLRHQYLTIRQQRLNPDFVPRTEDEKQLGSFSRQAPDALIYLVSASVEVRPLPGARIDLAGHIRQWAGADAQGYLQFASRPQDAPIIHFGGPLETALFSRQSLPRGDKPGDLMAMIGTHGLGPGTFASVSYNGIFSEDTAPVAEIEFPARGPGREPIKVRTALPHRC